MEMSKNQTAWITALVLAGVVLAVGYWLQNRGYGKVSQQTYEYSKALYSACLSKNNEHLNKIVNLLASDDKTKLPDNERKWLDAIIAEARDGNWETAAQKARRMMEDQVEF
jgi:hypothetical protein